MTDAVLSLVLQLGVALIALRVAVRALGISREANNRAVAEGTRAANREVLRWLHEAFNQLELVQQESLAAHSVKYEKYRQWLRTYLAVAGARGRLPLTTALSDRDCLPGGSLAADQNELVLAVDAAREELLEVLEHDADRAYAGELLGQIVTASAQPVLSRCCPSR